MAQLCKELSHPRKLTGSKFRKDKMEGLLYTTYSTLCYKLWQEPVPHLNRCTWDQIYGMLGLPSWQYNWISRFRYRMSLIARCWEQVRAAACLWVFGMLKTGCGLGGPLVWFRVTTLTFYILKVKKEIRLLLVVVNSTVDNNSYGQLKR